MTTTADNSRAPTVAATALVESGERLARERRRYEDLFDLSPGAYLVTDEETRIIAANRAAAALIRREPASLAGETLLGFARPDQRERLTALREAARAEVERAAVDDLIELRGERPVKVVVRCRAVRDPEAGSVQFCWILQDLTGPLEAERAARQTEEERAAHFRQLAEHWERLEAAKSDFLNLASHELRGPLTVLAGYLSMLEEGTFGELPPAVSSVVGVLVAKTHEVNGLVNDMLETARLDDDQGNLRALPVDVTEVVREVVDDWRALAGAGQELLCEVPAEPVCVDADPARLRTIVTNLVGNAIKYSPNGGTVLSRVEEVGNRVHIAVSDNGLGIAAENFDLLFTRFGRVLTSETRQLPGTGLGLYIARELARVHGGDISVTSELGKGSVFTVTLPARGRPRSAR